MKSRLGALGDVPEGGFYGRSLAQYGYRRRALSGYDSLVVARVWAPAVLRRRIDGFQVAGSAAFETFMRKLDGTVGY